jgi:hypothetical protein
VGLIQTLRRNHPLACVEAHGALPLRARPVEGDPEQLLAEAAAARLRTQVHALQLDSTVAQVAEGCRPDDTPGILRDPESGVARRRILQVAVERRINLEAELRQRVGDERTESICVPRLERDD